MTEFPRALKLATVWLLIGVAVFLGRTLVVTRA
jgi:hypothetical protein